MNRFIKSIAVGCISTADILLFRSNNFLKPLNLNLAPIKRMVNTLTVEELKQRSTQASELIEKLRNQIEQVKLQTTPVHMSERIKVLQQENENLKKEVENLKKELEAAEAQRGSQPVPVKSLAQVPTQAAPSQTKAEPKQPSKQTESKPKEAKTAEPKPAKQESKKQDVVEGPVDVSKLDIRVGKIVKCEKHPDAESLYVEQIDLGEGKLRNVCSGLVKFISLEDMQEKMVVLLCNLKPSKLRGVLSEAMVLCASTPEKVELLIPPAGAQVGDRVTVEGFPGEPAPECNQKNNIFGLVQPDLKTSDSLVAQYKGKNLEVAGKGVVTTSTLKNVPIK